MHGETAKYTSPTSFSLIWWPEWYLVRRTNHRAPHYIMFPCRPLTFSFFDPNILLSNLFSNLCRYILHQLGNFIHQYYQTFPQRCRHLGQVIIQCPLKMILFNPLNAELNSICHFLALLGAHHILHISRIRVNVYIICLYLIVWKLP